MLRALLLLLLLEVWRGSSLLYAVLLLLELLLQSLAALTKL
jgi:hypothetical protein